MTSADATPDLLAAYASGALSDGMSLLVATHLALSPESRRRVAAYERIGGALLCEAEPVAPGPDCLAGALARIRAGESQEASAADRVPSGQSGVFPVPLLGRLGAEERAIRWRFLLPGLSEYRLSGFESDEVRLLRARPGVRILQHTHVGEEATLILQGRMRDGDRVYGRGDVALADATDDHHPEIIGSEMCICLVVLSGPMRFTGPMGRALNLFAG